MCYTKVTDGMNPMLSRGALWAHRERFPSGLGCLEDGHGITLLVNHRVLPCCAHRFRLGSSSPIRLCA